MEPINRNEISDQTHCRAAAVRPAASAVLGDVLVKVRRHEGLAANVAPVKSRRHGREASLLVRQVVVRVTLDRRVLNVLRGSFGRGDVLCACGV